MLVDYCRVLVFGDLPAYQKREGFMLVDYY